MQKQCRHSYLALTRNHPLPSNCLPFSSRKQHSDSLTKLLQLNQTIMNIVDPSFNTVFGKRRRSHAHFIDTDKTAEEKNAPPKRIHPNVALLAKAKTHRKKYMSMEEPVDGQESRQLSKKRKDIYDDRIERFMSIKYNKQEVIEQYLKNRQSFVKLACEEIEQEIKQDARYLKRSSQKLKERSHKKLPKIEEFSSIKLKRNKERAKHGQYIKSITHLKKAETLDIKNRKRQQRVFRHKINSLECKLDKIRDDSHHH